MPQLACFQCSRPVETGDVVGRGDSCTSCGSDLRCCRNCEFYDPKVYNECHEPQAERVTEKDRSNFCGYFRTRTGPVTARVDQAAEAKRKLDELFKKK